MQRMLAMALPAALAASIVVMWSVWRQGEEASTMARYEVEESLLPDLCRRMDFEGVRYIACTADAGRHDIRLALKDRDGKPYNSVAAYVASFDRAGPPPLIAMNAGMYHADMTPVGLHVEHGTEITPLNRGDAFGNFFLKPNGVFLVGADGRPAVMETEAFAAAAPEARFATQSGPMLVIGGALHPRFLPDGTTRYIRNGVGVNAAGQAVFAITLDPVSLGSFGRFFRDAVSCPDSLFFDGEVSSLAVGTLVLVDSGRAAGPIVAVFDRERNTAQ